MLKDNLVMLRNVHGLSQEAIAEKIGISRQAYAKWETGATVPDVEKCALLAEAYGTTVDSLIRTEPVEGIGAIPPSPKGKNIWGSVAINDRGQIAGMVARRAAPGRPRREDTMSEETQGARDLFGLTGGQRLIVLTDEHGIALIPDEAFMASMNKAMELMNRTLGE